MSDRVPVVMTIAGSDSGGGAGIEADLKAFAAAGAHGTAAITALTAQSTVAVERVHVVPAEMIIAQVRVVADDIGLDAVKVGMLGTVETTAAVVTAITSLGDVPVVVDPVMVAESGAALLEADARRALIADLLPLATVVTPNLSEARELTGLGAQASPRELAAAVRALGPRAAIVTGGHTGEGVDLLDDGGEPLAIPGPLHRDGAAHGSGCTHSSTLAALLAAGWELRAAAVEARAVAAEAVRRGLRELGAGAGPVDVIGLRARSS